MNKLLVFLGIVIGFIGYVYLIAFYRLKNFISK